jgi:endo-1,4-beta-D-glucanase Y
MIKKLRIITAGFSIALAANVAHGAVTYPYTQAITYPYGFPSAKLTETDFQSWYSKYKSSQALASCNGGTRTTCVGENSDGGVDATKVESMGWATIIAAYMGDKTTYDGLMKFYNSKLSGHGMMGWKVTCGGVTDAGSASDGDLDVAFGALVAYWQWGGTYKDNATKIINTVEKLITNCNGTSVIVGGYSGSGGAYGGCSETDLSYYTPAFFREFAKFTGKTSWSKLADDTYYILEKTANQSTGLVPDWHTYNGAAYSGSRNAQTYRYDACRVPWRIAIDYLWNGNEKALAWCKKISDWANKTGAANIKDGYNPNGTASGSSHNMSFVGGFAVSAMCNSQTIADAFASEMVKMGFDAGFWYHNILGTIYTMTMTGHMWNPTLLEKTGVQLKTVSETASPMVVTNQANRTLNISGIKNVTSVNLTSMNGQMVKQTEKITNGTAALDVSSVKRGCYLLSTHGIDGKVSTTQVVLMK